MGPTPPVLSARSYVLVPIPMGCIRPEVLASPARAVQITEFGGPEVLNVVDLPDPVPGDGEQVFDVSTAGVNHADTHQA